MMDAARTSFEANTAGGRETYLHATPTSPSFQPPFSSSQSPKSCIATDNEQKARQAKEYLAQTQWLIHPSPPLQTRQPDQLSKRASWSALRK
jgi:hypothetical protein